MVAPIVDASWLADHPEAVLADVRSYADGRSGARPTSRRTCPVPCSSTSTGYLAAPPSAAEGRHPLPDPELFAEGMRQAGIGDDDLVVAYDDDSGAICAAAGLDAAHHRARRGACSTAASPPGTDGGSTASRRRPARTFTAAPWPTELLAQMDDLDGVPLLDARPADRYRGENEVVDVRPGHIPGRAQPAGAGQLRRRACCCRCRSCVRG